jgi:hypothetical protein
MDELTALVMDAGLLQFGWFDGGVPFKLHLDMLPGYPDVLRVVAAAAQPFLCSNSRLVCTAEALPLGVALSLLADVPVVYSRGRGEEVVNDLVGAYDIGHPALLLVNTLQCEDANSVAALIGQARQVGLDIRQTVAVVQVDTKITLDVEVHALLNLADVVETLVEIGRVPAGQGKAVSVWLENRDSK